MGLSPETGVLLVNLGTPDAPQTPEVRRYLREFLGDPRVIDINPVGRWLLVNLIIAPFRSPKSAEAYQKVWTEDGSPLLVHGKALTSEVQARLKDVPVELAMRYGNPSVRSGLERLRERGCTRVIALPLYPQYADSTTESSIEKIREEAAKAWETPILTFVDPFYDDEAFVRAFATVGKPVLDELQPDHVLFSYHGLPERHVLKTDPTGSHCLASADCCQAIGDANARCYRAQCFATSRALARELGLEPDTWTVAFQSRLGRDEWIKPYTTQTVEALAQAGKKRLAVFCPAFVADCLETIEEIGMRAEEDFRAAGGEALRLVPSLNAEPAWADAVVDLIERAVATAPPA
jgi:ferrochelatase